MKLFLDATVMQQPATGVAKATLWLYEECQRQMPSLQVAALHRKPLKCALPSEIQSIRCGSYLPGSAWRRLFLPAYVALKQVDAIHFPWNGNVPSFLSKTKVVTTLHDVLPLVLPGHFKSGEDEEAYRQRVQRDIDRTDLLITISEYSKKEIITNFRVEREPVVIPHGPTLLSNHVKPSSEAGHGGDYFIYVGGYDRRKGIDKLVKTFLALHRDNRITSKLILTGSKNYYSNEFKQLVDEGVKLGIVEEKGYVADLELGRLLAGAIALVYPSKYEGFGLPPLEAMALGCPVITTKCTAVPEVCGDAAYYINPDDEKEFAEGIISLQCDKELRFSLREKGFKQSGKFTWELAAHKFFKSLSGLSVQGPR